MSSPVTPAQLLANLVNPNGVMCDQFQHALNQNPLYYYQIFNWLLDANGNLSALATQQVRKPGTYVFAAYLMSEANDYVLLCDGRAVSRTTYAALFANIGTTYGAGDGSTTFNLPDWRNRFPVSTGTDYALGSTPGGLKEVTLTTAQIPSHTHAISANTYAGISAGSTSAEPDSGGPQVSGATGGGGAHENRPPWFPVAVHIAY